jgi:ribonuclease D
MTAPAHRFITRPDELDDVARALDQAPWVALDSESNSMFVYREQVCLLQLHVGLPDGPADGGGALFVVDPIALGVTAAATPSPVLDRLKPGLERRDRPLWLHGGEYDVAVVGRDFGIALGGVFDTQQAASLLGHEKTGYGSLVELLCGVKLGKAFATYDWATRPLDPAALAYALDDVVYLPRVAAHFVAAVKDAGIDDEVAVANAVVAGNVWTTAFDPQRLWRMKDLEALDAAGLKVLARLYAWRDAAAKADDVPPGRMVNDEVLKWLARHRPTTLAALSAARLKHGVAARHGDAAVAAIVAAADDPTPQRPPLPVVPPEVRAREDRLKSWRRQEAEARGRREGRTIPLQLVLPSRALEFLKVHGAADLDVVPQLGRARAARYGDALRRLCDGKASAPATPGPQPPD